jgi:hypothetical protein
MRNLLLISVLLIFSNFLVGQKYTFKEGGTMGQSQIYIDTFYHTKLRLNNQILFAIVDKGIVDSLRLGKLFPSKFKQILEDTLLYHMLLNLTRDNIKIQQKNNHLIAQELSKSENFGFKPINFFNYSNCCFGACEDFVLEPGQILILKNKGSRKQSSTSDFRNCFMKLQSSTNGVIVSRLYHKTFSYTDFFIDKKFEKDFEAILRHMAFTRK